ncbi:MAG: ABC transporter permease subunit [Planctomycetota bacterium]
MTDDGAVNRRAGEATARLAAGLSLGLYAGLLAAAVVALFARVTPAALLAALSRPDVLRSIVFTLATATTATALAVAVVVPAAWALRDFRGLPRLAADALLDLPHVVPPLVLGLMLLVAFASWPLDAVGPYVVYRPVAVVIAQWVATVAFLLPAVRGLVDATDRRAEGVARTLGRGPWAAFRDVTLPTVRGELVAVGLLGWARAVGCFGPVLAFAGVTRGRTEVLATTVYLELNAGDLDTALAVAALTVLLAAIVLTAVRIASGSRFSLSERPAGRP